MPARLRRAIPVLPSRDLGRTLEFYVDRLGFSVLYTMDDHAGLIRDDVEIHFWPCPDPAEGRNAGCRLAVTGIETLYEAARPLGIVHPHATLADKPWGFREFAVVDPSDNLVTFAEERPR